LLNRTYTSVTILLILCFWCLPGCKKSPTNEKDQNRLEPIDADGLFFDDFSYASSSDPSLNTAGWTIRTGGGGPGPADCVWDADGVTFVDDTSSQGNRLLKLSASTAGTGPSCHQAEFYSVVRYQYATFAARVFFTDDPVSGKDGDGLVQTFFTIAPWNLAYTDAYAEFDFEYLPNGGWGVSRPTLWQTSWETVEQKRNSRQESSHAGAWHTLLIQTDTTESRYYVDGELRTTHREPYVADGLMSVNFNHWFIEASLQSNITQKREYAYFVDWVLVQADSMVTPEDVEARVVELREKGYERIDLE